MKHEPSGFCFYIKGIKPNTIFEPIIYTKKKSSNTISKIFVSKLAKVTNKIYNDFYKRAKPLRLTKEEQMSFDKAKTCYKCILPLLKDKVRDHCHFTGQYRGAAHNSCNLQCRKPMILPVIFHNLQGYDAHLFIKQLSTIPGDLNCIPSTEKSIFRFPKKLKLSINLDALERLFHCILKYDLLIHLSFFKRVLLNLLKIYNQMIFIIQKK